MMFISNFHEVYILACGWLPLSILPFDMTDKLISVYCMENVTILACTYVKGGHRGRDVW
jgi:hypothetical protein